MSAFDALWTGQGLGDLFTEFAEVAPFTHVPMRTASANVPATPDTGRTSVSFRAVVDLDGVSVTSRDAYDSRADQRPPMIAGQMLLHVRSADFPGVVRVGDRITRGGLAWTVIDPPETGPGMMMLTIAKAGA